MGSRALQKEEDPCSYIGRGLSGCRTSQMKGLEVPASHQAEHEPAFYCGNKEGQQHPELC